MSKRIMSIGAFLGILFFNLSSLVIAEEAPNLLKNPSFEEGEVGKIPKWHKETLSLQGGRNLKETKSTFTKEQGGKFGEYVAVLSKSPEDEWIFVSQYVNHPFKIGEEYVLSAWMQAEKPVSADIALQAFAGTKVSANIRKTCRVDTEWRRFELFAYIEHEDGKTFFRIIIQHFADAVKLEIDNVRLYKAEADNLVRLDKQEEKVIAGAQGESAINVPHLSAPPVLDGVESKSEWAGASGSLVCYRTDEDTLAVPSGRFRIGQCDGKLYLLFVTDNMDRLPYCVYPLDKDPASPRAWYQDHPHVKTWRDDGIRVTFKSRRGEIRLIPNASGLINDARNGNSKWKGGPWEIATSVIDRGKGSQGFVIELAMPIKALRLGQPKDGDTWQFQIALNLMNYPAYALWNPVRDANRLHIGGKDIDFGTLVWGGKPEFKQVSPAPATYVREFTPKSQAEPFFPIGVWAGGGWGKGEPDFAETEAWCESTFKYLSERGFNTVHTFIAGAQLQAADIVMRIADKYGLKVIHFAGPLNELCPRSTVQKPFSYEEALAKVREVADKVAAYPAFLRYYYTDEPALRWMPNWVTIQKAIAEVDPKHGAFTFMDKLSSIRYAARHSTVTELCFDHYPHYLHVPPQSLGDFLIALDDYVKAANGVPLWATLQAFYGRESNVPLAWRAPSQEETRATVYLSLASGVKGIFWFCLGNAYNPSTSCKGMAQGGIVEYRTAPIGEQVFVIARELKQLAPLLAQLRKTQPLEDKDDYRVGRFVDQVNREVLIVASKRPDKEVSASVAVKGSSVWKDALTGETFRPKSGNLVLQLAPGAGRVLEGEGLN